VGGSSLGGATATAPAGGFNNQDLAVYFAQQASVASRTPTRSIPTPTNTTSPINTAPSHKKKSLSTGAIVGIAIGGALFLIALFVAGFCLIRRHRRKQPPPSPAIYHTAPDYSQMPQSPNSQYSHNVPQTPRYQLQANSIPIPAELSSNNYQEHPRDPKEAMMQQINDRDHPAYWHQQNASPVTSSPHPSAYSPVTEINTNTINTMYSQASPVPSYSSTGRSSRKPVPPNHTYYSP